MPWALRAAAVAPVASKTALESMKMEPKSIQKHEKKCLGRFGCASLSHERHSANAGLRICDHFSGKDRFRVPFWTPVDFEGGHKIALFDTMFKKKCKNDT